MAPKKHINHYKFRSSDGQIAHGRVALLKIVGFIPTHTFTNILMKDKPVGSFTWKGVTWSYSPVYSKQAATTETVTKKAVPTPKPVKERVYVSKPLVDTTYTKKHHIKDSLGNVIHTLELTYSHLHSLIFTRSLS